MTALTEGGTYSITKSMREKLADFYGYYADEEETAETIRDLYQKTGYVIDTHTAVASCVYGKYRKETGDTKPTVLASTASPFKFTRSVMAAIDTKYEESEDLELADMLSQISKVKMPKAIEEIRTAPVLHNHLCEKDEMKQAVLEFLSK